MVDDCRRSLPSESAGSIAGIVLAGTYQWTGSPFDEMRPRPLLPVALRPLIDYVVDWLDTAGVSSTTICANGSTDAIRRHLESRTSTRVKLDYYADHSPRGAAGCIKDAAAAKTTAQTFIVSDGTSIPHVDVEALIAHHQRTGAAITMVVHPCDGKLTGQRLLEPTGTYVFDRSVLDLVPATSFFDIKENLVPSAHRHGRVIELFETTGASPRVLNAASYVAANRWVAERIAKPAQDASQSPQDRFPELEAHPSAWIDDSATIVGPVMLGRGARVHAGVVLVGPTIIGANTVIESGAVVSRSVTWEGCVIGAKAVVDQCLLTDGAVVEPGTSLSTVLRAKSQASRSFLKRLAQRLEAPSTATPLTKHVLSWNQSASSTRQ